MRKKSLKKIISLLLAALFVASTPVMLSASPTVKTQQLVEDLPKSVKEVRSLEKRTLQELDTFLENYNKVQKRTFENTVANWKRMKDKIITSDFLLATLGIASNDEKTIEAGKEAAINLGGTLIKTTHQQILPNVVAYLENTPLETLSAAQRNAAYLQLSEAPAASLTQELEEKTEILKLQLANYPMEGFTYRKGMAEEKMATDHNFSILTLNVCAFSDLLPMLYGGPIPWQQRIDSLTKRILDADADVITLQEVFDPEANLALYERLKDKYAYFYTDIGPRADIVGISSGLFVASKYKIENPEFTLFSEREKLRAYGFFEFDLTSESQTLGHITTTHLQPYQSDQGLQLRTQELDEIIKKLSASNTTVPVILLGDLNIQWGSNEPAEQLLKEHFIDNYNKDRTSIDENSRTCMDFTDYWWRANRNPKGFEKVLEVIDYTLLLKTSAAHNFQIETKRISMGELTSESVPDSDHDALFSQINST